MKKILVVLSLFVLLCTLLTTGVMATEAAATGTETTGAETTGAEAGTTEQGSAMDEMPPMEFEIDGEAFVDSLSYMGQGMLGIFVVTLVIIGVVAILNWHGRHLEKKFKESDE